MAAATKGQTPHTSGNKLEDHAATAALYVTRSKTPSTTGHSVLDEDGKLSSASAAVSLKYARPQDLPSFPSAGLKMSSAGAAASLAEQNKKSFEYWKPGDIPAANRAAFAAKDYEMEPLWQPEMSAAGSKAAILAQRDGGDVKVWRPTASEAGSSAAGQAMHMKLPGPITERDGTADGHRKALLGATGAMAAGRRRAGSAPIKQEPDNSWAVGAATKSQQRGAKQNQAYFGTGDPGFDAARIQNMAKGNVNRQMYGSKPPVALEVEEQNRQKMLRASAVAMAQKMYAIQQQHIEEAKGQRPSDSHYAATEMHRRGLSDTSNIEEPPAVTPNQYHNLEEAARKLAMERLAKIHDEHAEYRSYYGQPTPTRSRLSIRGRRRSSSDGQFDKTDEEQSQKIRSQMSMFQSKLAAVDSKKRQGDRDAVMAAAQKNVAARMATMDDKVFQETGKSSPHQQDLWEKEARERAQKDSDDRMVNHGKVHIGGGKYLDQADVDAIARARLQPTLDEISDNAEQRRARDEELRLEQEKQKRDAEIEKQRAADIKAELKKQRDVEKQEETARKMEAKQVEQAKKQEEQARRAEEKRVQREEAAAEKEKARAAKEENRTTKDAKGKRFGGLFGAATAGASFAAAEPAVVAATETTPVTTETTTQPLLASDSSHPTDVHFLTTVPNPEEAAEYDEPAQAKEVVLPEADAAVIEDTEPQPAASTTADITEPTGVNVAEEAPAAATTSEEPLATATTTEGPVIDSTTSPTSPKGESRVKSWLKSRFRASSKAQKDTEDDATKPGFVGGAALTGAGVGESSPDRAKSDSIREVAMVGRSSTREDDDLYGASEKDVSPVNDTAETQMNRSPSISSMSNSDYDESGNKEAPRGRRGFKERMLGKSATKASAEDHENDEFEEARDTFDEAKLTPPPKLTTIAGTSTKSNDSPSRERSKFTEDL